MSDLNADPVVKQDESPRNAETSKINFLNFLSNIQSLESYQDFIRSESLNFVCDWCHFPQDESKVSVLGHSETFVCPCEIDLRLSEDHCSEALCVQSLVDIVGETGKMSSSGESGNSRPVTGTLENKSKKCNCNDKMFVSMTNWVSRLRQSFLLPKMATNTNNSSLRGHCGDLGRQRSGAIQSEETEETLEAGWKNDPSESGYPFIVSLGEIPLYQVERTLQLNKKSGNYQTNDSAYCKRRSDSKKAKRNCDCAGPPYVYSVIRKTTPQDKNHFLCRPAIGSDDNFIEIRSERGYGGLVDNLCPAQNYVDVCESRGANPFVFETNYAPWNSIGSSKCIGGPRTRHGHDSLNSGAFSVSTGVPFRIVSSEPYVYQPLLKIKGGYTYARQLQQSTGNNRYASRLLTESYNKGATSLHPTTCTRHHVACNSSPLASQSFHSSKTHHGWSCFQHKAKRRPMFPIHANRTNNALSSPPSRSASCNSIQDALPSPILPEMRIAKVRGDGRCLFRSLVTGMHKSLQHSPRTRNGSLVCQRCEAKEKRRADRLRAKVVQFMEDNAHLYSDLEIDVINGDQPNMDTYKKFKDRLADMSNNSSCPGEMELNAASLVLKCPIAVVNKDLQFIIVYGENRFPSAQPLTVRFMDLNEDVGHFDAVIPICPNHMDNYSGSYDSGHSGGSKNNTRQSNRKIIYSYSDSRLMKDSGNLEDRMDPDLNVCNHNHKVRKSLKKKSPRKSKYGTYRRKDAKKSRRCYKSAESSSHKLRKSKYSKSKSPADLGENPGFFSMLKSYCLPGMSAKKDVHAEKMDKSKKRKRVSESPSSCSPTKKARTGSPCKKKATKKQRPPGRQPSMGIRGYQPAPPSQSSCFVCGKDFESRDTKTWLQCCKCFGEAHRMCAVRYSTQPPKGIWFLCQRCNQKWVKK